MVGGLPDAADRAASAVRALDRAEDDVTAAVGLLVRAGAVTWTGAGAAGYRDDLVTVLAGVRRTRAALGAGRAAAAQHVAALGEVRARACVTGPGPWPPP